MAKISIVVPIYNSEKYLCNCIDSILCQSFDDFELILVDDGSTDSSASICDNYEKLDNRVNVIHKTNGGVSKARNTGIDVASGKFICFIDSDDSVNSDYLEKLYLAYENDIDLSVVGYNWIKNNCVTNFTVFNNEPETIIDKNNIMFLYEKVMISAPWCKLYKLDIIKENKLIFPEDLSLGEDLIFNFSYLDFVNRIKIINTPLYNYNTDNENSLLQKYRADLLETNSRINSIVYMYICKWKLDHTQMQIFINSVFWSYENVLLNTFSVKNKAFYFDKLRYNRQILKSEDFKKALKNYSGNINAVVKLGYKLHSYSLILFYNKLRRMVR
ncbi:MAG: glycosyltransferase family 2 protein [Ruminococcus sp.]|nr:glycosyltransferase family 2 protein [Ruminococcus sp.]